MHKGRTLKIIFLLWTVLLLCISVKSAVTIAENEYIEHGLLHCAVAGHIEDVHWTTFLFVLSTAGIMICALLLRPILREPLQRLRASVKVFLFLLAAYLAVVYVNTKSWYPEFYTPKGLIYNGVVLIAILVGIVLMPMPLRKVSSLLGRIDLRIPVGICILLYMAPLLSRTLHGGKFTTNVLFITVDTLRPDHLSMNGYFRETSRHIDAFSKECLVFHNAYSQSSFTPPSHASMFTSRIVSNHELYAWEKLADEQITLAEILSNEGFRTGAFVNMSLLSDQNLGQGFHTSVESFLNLRNCLSEKLLYTMKKKAVDFYDGNELNRMFFEWLGRQRQRPFFVWLHYWDVHRPYARDERYEAMYSDGSIVDRRVGRELWHYNLSGEEIRNLEFSTADLAYISDRYDAGIYMFDLAFRELVDGLKELGVFDNTLIILTSDHGESLLERDEMFFAHDPFLYNEVIRVPLLVRLPGNHARREVNEQVMLVDLFPSILRFLAIQEKYPIDSDGTAFDLAGIGGVSAGARDILSECFGWRHKRAIIAGSLKYIYDFEKKNCELYDLERDAAEKMMLEVDSGDSRVLEMMNKYDNDFVDDLRGRSMDNDQYERLKALGYVEL